MFWEPSAGNKMGTQTFWILWSLHAVWYPGLQLVLLSVQTLLGLPSLKNKHLVFSRLGRAVTWRHRVREGI